MELIEVSEQGFLPVSTALGGGQNLILQGFRHAHFINDGAGGGDTYELLEEFPATAVDGHHASFVQVVEPSPTVIVNYIIGANGSLIPVYDSLPIDNTLTIVTTGASEHVSDATVPPHILDHMYAKKPKEPGSESTTKPRKRVKKKEPPPPVATTDYVMPEIISANTTKVNIIRKGQNTPPQTFRQLLSSRPKILQNTKSITSPQRVVASSMSDLSSTQPIPTRTSPASSIATSYSSDPSRSDINGVHSSSPVATTPSLPNQTPSIYFLPPRANPSVVNNIIGSTVVGTECTKTSFIVTTEEVEGEGGETKEMCLVLPSTSSSSSSPSSPLSKTDVDGQQHQHQTGEVQTFQLNSDGTISAVTSAVDETVSRDTDSHQTEMYSEFSIGPFSEDMAESDEGVVGESATAAGGSFQIGDKKIYFSYG